MKWDNFEVHMKKLLCKISPKKSEKKSKERGLVLPDI